MNPNVSKIITTDTLKTALTERFPTPPTRDEFYQFIADYYESQDFSGGNFLIMDTIIEYAKAWAEWRGWEHVS